MTGERFLTMADAYASYEAAVVAEDATAIGRKVAKRIFYAGAIAALRAMSDIASVKADDTTEAAMCTALIGEILEYLEGEARL